MKATNPTTEELLRQRLAGVLPTIDIAGHPFIVDWRLKELRAADNPAVRIDLRNMDVNNDGDKYLCLYHLPTRQVVPLSDTITRLPTDTVMLEIPYELRLDPVGVAREYGLGDTEMLGRFPIQQELKADIIPLEKTALPAIIEQNRAKLKPTGRKHKKNRGRKL